MVAPQGRLLLHILILHSVSYKLRLGWLTNSSEGNIRPFIVTIDYKLSLRMHIKKAFQIVKPLT